MKEIKVVVVDDSPFSVGMISNILTENGFDVVGSANCLKEAVEAVAKLKPDLVTMDMAMPGGDGIECTKAIHTVDPDVKVIIVSSMMDGEIVRRTKKVRISGYIQKPVDSEEIALLIRRVMADEELFVELNGLYFDAFKEAMTISLNRFFRADPGFKEERMVNDEKTSRGFSVVMGIIGKYGGRMLLDMSAETARNLACHLSKEEALNGDLVVNVIAELSNIIAGNACSMINRTNNLFGFRVAPPTTVYGDAVKISRAELTTVSSVIVDTPFGEIYMNIGFSRSSRNE